MSMREIKFTERWTEHLEQHRESAKGLDGERIHVIFHTTRYCSNLMNGFDKVTEKDKIMT